MQGAKRAKDIKAHTYVECTSRDPASVGKVVMEAVGIVLEADKAIRAKNQKQFTKEKKEEDKIQKKAEKKKLKDEADKTKGKQREPSSSPPPS